MRLVVGFLCLALSATAPAAAEKDPASAAYLLPACRLYLQVADRGERLRLERGVCIGTTETVLRLHRQLRAGSSFCPPDRVTLETAVRAVVAFAEGRSDLDRPLLELAIEGFQQKWPC
jgi:hypothetical protein